MTKTWFVDTALNKMTKNVQPIPGRIKKHERNPLMIEGLYDTPCLPWEPRYDNGYPNVFYDPLAEKYRCYYTCIVQDITSFETPLKDRPNSKYQAKGERITAFMYAESQDGYHWERPSLGITEFQGSKENNILFLYIHGGSVMLDMAEADPQKRYKMIARDDHFPRRLVVAFSADGIHFTWPLQVPEWAEKVPGDTHNFTIRTEDGRYLLFTRLFSRELRTSGILESDDFIHWRNLQEVCKGLDKDHQVYAMPVFRSGGLYWGLAAIFHEGDTDLPHHDHVDVELTYSGDGVHWYFAAYGKPFIPNGKGVYGNGDYDAGCCFGSVPIADGDQYRFYYMGGNGTHYHFRETSLCLATISQNRLAGITAKDKDNPFFFQTIRMKLNGKMPMICADVDEGGSIRYALYDINREVIKGYEAENCEPVTANVDQQRLCWHTTNELPEQVMIRFYGEKAVLYSLDGEYDLVPIHPL